MITRKCATIFCSVQKFEWAQRAVVLRESVRTQNISFRKREKYNIIDYVHIQVLFHLWRLQIQLKTQSTTLHATHSPNSLHWQFDLIFFWPFDSNKIKNVLETPTLFRTDWNENGKLKASSMAFRYHMHIQFKFKGNPLSHHVRKPVNINTRLRARFFFVFVNPNQVQSVFLLI